ncbi:MAG: biotin/lipoate A/B protein ligase family protein [Thermodesulfobacteriota bacterium]
MENWRLIVDGPASGVDNMATDEALLAVAGEERPALPVLRLYAWASPTVSVGYLQKVADLEGAGVPVVRRITGGRALLHDMELTYSVVADARCPLFAGGIAGSYGEISRCLADALRAAGVTAEFTVGGSTAAELRRRACFGSATRFEVLADGGKIVASAQRRLRGAFLQHGSILMGADEALNERLFGPGVIERMSWVGAYSSISADALGGLVVERFSLRLGARFAPSGLTEREREVKEALAAEKLSDPEKSLTPPEFLTS